MRHLTPILILAVSLCWGSRVFSQNNDSDLLIKYRDVTVEDGLSSRFVYRIFQDSDNYMWFVTSEGLNRYDGYRMDVFHLRRIGGRVHFPYYIMEDCASNFWLANYSFRDNGGQEGRYGWILDILDPVSRKITPADSLLPFPIADLNQIGHVRGSLILFGTKNGVVYGYDGSFFELFRDPGGQPIEHLAGTAGGLIYFAAGETLWILDRNGNPLHRAAIGDGLTGFSSNAKGDIWGFFGQNPISKRLVRFYPDTGQDIGWALPAAYQNQKPNYLHYIISPDGDILLEGSGILQLFNYRGDLVYDFSSQVFKKTNTPYYNAMLFGRSGSLWMTTATGVTRMTWRRNPFGQFLHKERYSIRGLGWVNDSTLLVSNYTRSLLLNVRSGEQSPLPGSDFIGLGVARDKEGYWWMGCHKESFFRFSPDFRTVKEYPVEIPVSPFSRPMIDCTVPFTDSRGKVWLGTSLGLGYFDPVADRTVYLSPAPRYAALQQKSINCFLETNTGVWVGTSAGLYLVHSDGEVLFFVSDLEPFSIYHIHQDKQGRLWLATRGDGLICWDPGPVVLKVFSTQTGFICDVIYSILEDDGGIFWLSTNNGLIRFDPNTGYYAFFRGNDGLAGEEFNFLAYAKGPDGRLYLGGIDGITTFHPDSVNLVQPLDLPVKVTGYYAWEPETGKVKDLTKTLLEQRSITLRPPVQAFQLSFALMSYQQPGNFQYAYWVEDLDRGWTFLSEPTLRLSRIPHGKYILHVNGRGENGQWSTQELRIPLTVKRPFYLRPLFWGLTFFALLGAAFLYYRIYVWNLKRRHDQLEQEVDRRTKDLQESRRIIGRQYEELEKVNRTKDHLFLILAHELKNPVLSFRNLSQKIDFLLKKNQMDRLRLLGSTLDRTAADTHNLLDNLLQWAKTQRGTFAVHPRAIALDEAFRQVLDQKQERAREKGIDLTVCPDASQVSLWADPTALQVLLRNLVDNAIKFTPRGGKVYLDAKRLENAIVIRVEDTGQGLRPERLENLFISNSQPSVGTDGERGSGLGLLLVKELMNLHGGQIKVLSQINKGSTFELIFPDVDAPGNRQS